MKLKIILAICFIFGAMSVSAQCSGAPYTSCSDAAAQVGPNNGWYLLTDGSTTWWAYCKFYGNANTGVAYALFTTFRRLRASWGFHGNQPFTLDYPRSEQEGNQPQPTIVNDDNTFWHDYRWNKDRIDYYRNLPIVNAFLASCALDASRLNNDYWYVEKSGYDIVTQSDLNAEPYINCSYIATDVKIRGHSCFVNGRPDLDCNVGFWSWFDLHFHIESSWQGCFGHRSNVAGEVPFDFQGDALSSEDNFGMYWTVNFAHQCSADNNATTNYWLCSPYNTQDCTPAPTSTNVGGDPHFKSLDGLKFKYDGPCSYILTTNKCGGFNKEYPLFEVISHHGRCRKRWRGLACVKKVTIRIWKTAQSKATTIEIESHENVMVNGYKMDLPYNDELMDATVSETKVNEKTYQRVNIKVAIGLDVMWTNDAAAVFSVSVAEKYKTCGLLGNNNGKLEDDLTMRDGTVLKYKASNKELDNDIVKKMGDSWMVKTPNQPLRCDLYPTSSMSSLSQCAFDIASVKESCENMLQKQLKKLKGKNIAKCFPKDQSYDTLIDQTRIYDDCITEVCACKKDLFKDCVPKVAIKEFKDACSKNGVNQFPDIQWEYE